MTTFTASQILEALPIGFLLVDPLGRIRMCNGPAKSILGLSAGAGEDGAPLSLDPQLLVMIAQGKQGRTLWSRQGRILEVRYAPSGGIEGNFAGSVITLVDISEQERRRIEETNGEKHAAMGKLAADIAHEIRNPLGGIELLASLMRKEARREKDSQRLAQIIAAVKNMEHKISSLIQFSQTVSIAAQDVNLHELLQEILSLNGLTAEEMHFMTAQYAEVEPVIACNREMIRQVFLNIILHSLRALPDTSRLAVRTLYRAEPSRIDICFFEENVSPSGGQPSDILNRLSLTQRKNWGLGLAIIHNIVNMYGGSIRLEHVSGWGAAFIVSFPLTSTETNSAPGQCPHSLKDGQA